MTDSRQTSRAYSLNELSRQPVKRIATLYPELDYVYGSSQGWYGLPAGAVSLWSGARGVGKTRIACAVAMQMAWYGYRVLYAQTEMELGIFAARYFARFPDQQPNLLVTDTTRLAYVAELIRAERPQLAIVDSVQGMTDWRRRDIGALSDQLHESASEAQSHVVLISQQNAEGRTMGGSAAEHYADVVIYLSGFLYTGVLAKPAKNRFGGASGGVLWQHRDWGAWCTHHIGDLQYFDPDSFAKARCGQYSPLPTRAFAEPEWSKWGRPPWVGGRELEPRWILPAPPHAAVLPPRGQLICPRTAKDAPPTETNPWSGRGAIGSLLQRLRKEPRAE